MIKKFILEFLQENCYLVINNHKAICIDPGYPIKPVIKYLSDHNILLEAILLTHAHYDHIAGIPELMNFNKDIKIYASLDSSKILRDPIYNLSNQFGKEFRYYGHIELFSEKMTFLDQSVQIIPSPGHLCGSVLIYFEKENALFTGDSLFKGNIGRYDFPGSSITDMSDTCFMLSQLKFDATVYSGHGPETTLKIEQIDNPYLQNK
ncbi:MBL fold metallo-hydrolase [Eggerthia catenaformis]|uniref:MBL fold metallo-hydrolase n=1 Tax=Eggerthia catenaformis TaxID=31973 RepID=UPI00248E9506|nr:MBL fold metallo-hydrolase [Eggerthia catenaformis]